MEPRNKGSMGILDQEQNVKEEVRDLRRDGNPEKMGEVSMVGLIEGQAPSYRGFCTVKYRYLAALNSVNNLRSCCPTVFLPQQNYVSTHDGRNLRRLHQIFRRIGAFYPAESINSFAPQQLWLTTENTTLSCLMAFPPTTSPSSQSCASFSSASNHPNPRPLFPARRAW